MIYADENVWLTVANGLRRRGWEVTTANEAGTLGLSDRDHLRFAVDHGWLLLTFDDDFLGLVETNFADTEHAGVIYAEQYRRTVGDLVRSIDTTLRQNEARLEESDTVRLMEVASSGPTPSRPTSTTAPGWR